MHIPQKLFFFLSIFLVSVSFATAGSARDSSSGINPYISYEGLTIDVRNINASILPGFQKANAEDTDYYLVKLADAIKTEWRAELEQKGATILWYVPYNAYLIKMNTVQANRIKSLPFVYWAGVQQPYFKLSPEVRNLLIAKDLSSAALDNGRIKLGVTLYAAETSTNLKSALASSGLGQIISEVANPHNTRMFVNIAPADYYKAVNLFAQMKEVEAIEIRHKFQTENDAARWVHQRFVNASYPLYTQNLRGQNQIGGISDTGIDYDMCYFRDTALGTPPFDNTPPFGDIAENLSMRKMIIYYSMDATSCTTSGTPGDNHGHGTHTGGTFVGDNFATACGTGNGDAGDGMAMCSKVVVQDMGGTLNFINIPCGSVYDVINIAYLDGARVHSNSWGWGCDACPCSGNMYNTDARDVDQFVWEHKDMTMFFSAGNSGGSCGGTSNVGTPSVAKNCCSIGATNHDSLATGIASFSSKGLSSDLRLKPDFTAQGNATISASNDGNVTSNNCTTTSMSGTSMACPTAASYGLLTRQYYTAGYYPTGSPVPANGFAPSAALVKATMINSAVDMTGVTGLPPNITEGWGRLSLDNALFFTGYAHKLWVVDQTVGIGTGFSRCYYVNNASTSQSLKVTLTWSDYPAVLFSSPAIVNDLNLEVTNPAGTTTYHQTLDASYYIVQSTTPSDPQDNRNTVDQILVTTPPTGTWVIKVTGVNVPQPYQPYALVVTGDVTNIAQPAVPTATTATASAANQITVGWTAATGATCYNVYRSTGACPGSAWQKIASCVAATSYQDNTVSAATTYSYKVTAIYASSCESDYSTCAQATATGICTLGPTFAGVSAVINNTVNPCGVTVQWAPGTSQCASYPTLTYTIYKSTDPAFVPGPSNQIATCRTGTTYSDSNVAAGLTFYYVVRAEDSRPGGGSGPCNSGNIETNTTKAYVSPTGPGTTLFTDNAGDSGSALMLFANSTAPNWTNSTARNHTPAGTRSYASGGANSQCAWVYSPNVILSGGNPIYALEFWGIYDIEAGTDSGIIEVSNNGGTSWTKVTPKQGYPFTTISAANACNGPNTTGFTGPHLTWTYYDVDLSSYGAQTINFRFKYGTDAGGNREGWYVDDMNVKGYQICQNGSPTCTSPPIFSGLATATSAGTSSCQVNLAWNAGSSTCSTGPNIKYHIYRSTDPAFVPAPANLIAQCLTGTTYADTNVSYGSTYYYVVRAEDSTANGAGPCNNGNSDLNIVKKSVAPSGPQTTLFSDGFESGVGSWTISASWAAAVTYAHTGTYSLISNDPTSLACATCSKTTASAIPAGSSANFMFWTRYAIESGYDGGIIYGSSNGTTYTKLTPVPAYPGTVNGVQACLGATGSPAFSGTNATWTQYTISLASYAGGNFWPRFTYGTDPSISNGGWYIDDVLIDYGSSCSTGTNLPGRVFNTFAISKSGTNLNLSWQAPNGTCQPTGYGLYRGTLPWTAYNHANVSCSITTTSTTTPQDTGSYYYLIVPLNTASEGSYGAASSGSQIPQGSSPCRTQDLTACN